MQELKRCGLARDTRETREAISTLNSKFSATAEIVSNIPNKIQGIGQTSYETRTAVAQLSNSVSEKFAHLPVGINKMFATTLRSVLQEFYKDSNGPQMHSGIGNNEKGHVDHIYTPADPGLRSDISEDSSCRVLKQKRRKVAVQTWFGTVFIHSTTSTTQETINTNCLKVRVNSPRTILTHLHVVITPCMLRIGLFCAIIWRRNGDDGPGFNMNLRVYNKVDKTAPIIQACKSADIQEVKRLFSKGQASPFDRLEGKQSLLDIILERMVLLPMRQDPKIALKKLKDLFDLFKMMVGHGLDPGQLWSHRDKSSPGPLPFLAMFPFFSSPEFVPTIHNTARIIIENSIQDPFSTADFTELLRFLQSASAWEPLPVTQLVLHQEHWQPEWEIKETVAPYQSDKKPMQLGPRDAQCLRTWLEHAVDQREAVMALRYSSHLLANVIRYGGLREDIGEQFYYHHICVALKFGIDFQDDSDGPSLLATLRECGKLYQLRTALRNLLWEEDDINDLFETELLASLAFQIAHLEHREVHGRALPTAMRFELISAPEWNHYLRELDYGVFNRCSSRSIPQTQPGQGRMHVSENDYETIQIGQQHDGNRARTMDGLYQLAFSIFLTSIGMILGLIVSKVPALYQDLVRVL